jgi:IS5 family transposase
VLPYYRSRFSKHQFTQPQLLAIPCLMRYKEWTFREAKVRLAEHREFHKASGLVSVPDFTTLCRFRRRLDEQTIERPVGETVRYDGLGARSGQHILHAAHASSRGNTAPLALLAKVVVVADLE